MCLEWVWLFTRWYAEIVNQSARRDDTRRDAPLRYVRPASYCARPNYIYPSRLTGAYCAIMSLALRRPAIIVVTVVVPHVCVCVCLFVVLPALASRPRNIGKLTYVFTAARKTLLYIIIVILFAENASFRSYGVICLPRMPLTTLTNQCKLY